MARNRVVIITGATRGLGRALVEQIINAGNRVAGCGSSPSHIESLRSAYSNEHSFSTVDLRDANAVDGWAKSVISKMGPPDLLINNAGVINQNAPLWEIAADEFQHVVDVNLCGIASTIRSFVPSMIEAGTGVIVNFSSTWGRSTSPEVAPYCASKWGVEGLTQALSQELPRGLAAVALNPGIINTEMLQSCFGIAAASYETPEEWGERAAKLILKLTAKDNGRSLSA
jgi:NAD(P)-dependent dehydrogenase (short-subunit alcohol dehydrogenase family)